MNIKKRIIQVISFVAMTVLSVAIVIFALSLVYDLVHYGFGEEYVVSGYDLSIVTDDYKLPTGSIHVYQREGKLRMVHDIKNIDNYLDILKKIEESHEKQPFEIKLRVFMRGKITESSKIVEIKKLPTP